MEEIKESKGKKKETEEKKKSPYELALEKLTKDYGKGIVMGSRDVPQYQETVSTGSLKFDKATGVWGIPLTGCIIELLGWESSGKSTFCLYIMGNAQSKTGKKALLIDGEHSFDPVYAESLGVNLDELDVTQPDCLEDAFNIAEVLVGTGEYCIVVLDSHTSLKPRKVVDGQVGDSHLGLEARVMGDGVNKALRMTKKGNLPFIFISQLREKIGAMGNPETTSGGNALKFYAHMRIDIRKRIEKDKEGPEGVAIANETNIKVIKNKFAPPYGEAKKIRLEFGQGVDRVQEIIELGSEVGVIGKAGSWYNYGDVKVQGEDALGALLLDNPALLIEIEEKTIDLLKLGL